MMVNNEIGVKQPVKEIGQFSSLIFYCLNASLSSPETTIFFLFSALYLYEFNKWWHPVRTKLSRNIVLWRKKSFYAVEKVKPDIAVITKNCCWLIDATVRLTSEWAAHGIDRWYCVEGALCRKKKVFFHTDAAQAIGKISINVNEMNIDLMSISGHKIYGPKGDITDIPFNIHSPISDRLLFSFSLQIMRIFHTDEH